MSVTRLIAVVLGFGLMVAGQGLDAKPIYQLDHHIALPGDTGWDYMSIDGAARRLYITRGQQVDVLDLNSEKIVGSITGTAGVHGVAIDTELGKGFISNGLSGTVKVFDLKTLETRRTISVGEHPDAILYDSFSRRVFVFNGKSKSVSVIDAVDEKVIATIDLKAKPEFGVSDEKGNVYVNLEDKNSIADIDAKTMKLRAVWPLNAKSPSGLAIDRDHGFLFSVCDDKKMEVVNVSTGKVVAELAIGEHPDAARFDSDTQLAFSSNGEGSLTVVKETSPSSFAVEDTVLTQKGARTMALDPVTRQIYLICSQYLKETEKVGPEHHHPKIQPGSVELLVLKKL